MGNVTKMAELEAQRETIVRYVEADVLEKLGKDGKRESKGEVLEILRKAGAQRVQPRNGLDYDVFMTKANERKMLSAGEARGLISLAALMEICDVSSSKVDAAVKLGRITQEQALSLVASIAKVPRVMVREVR